MNIVLIMSDTFRADYLGCYGNKWVKTPYLDTLARKSAIFDRAYTASFPTVPNRMDLATGRFTFPYREWQPLPKDEIVISEMLKSRRFQPGMDINPLSLLRPATGAKRLRRR